MKKRIKLLLSLIAMSMVLSSCSAGVDQLYENDSDIYNETIAANESNRADDENTQSVNIDDVIDAIDFDFPPKREAIVLSVKTIMNTKYGIDFSKWKTIDDLFYSDDYYNSGFISNQEGDGFLISFQGNPHCDKIVLMSGTDIYSSKYWSITCRENAGRFMLSSFLEILFGNCRDLAYTYDEMNGRFNSSPDKKSTVTSVGNYIESVTYKKSGIEFTLTKFSKGQYEGKEELYLDIRIVDENELQNAKCIYAEQVLAEYNKAVKLYEEGKSKEALKKLEGLTGYREARLLKDRIASDDSRETSSMDHATSSESSRSEVSDYEPSVSKDDTTSTAPGHVHTYVYHSGKNPTCTESGYADYKTCDGCGYSDYRSIPALGHQYVLSEKREATCDENGYTEYKCANCGDSYKETIYATGHDLAPATCLAPSTCRKCGKQFGAVGEHEYNVQREYNNMDGNYELCGIQCQHCGKFNTSWANNHTLKFEWCHYPKYNIKSDDLSFTIDASGHCILTIYYKENGDSKADVIEFFLKNETIGSSTRTSVPYIYECYDEDGKRIEGLTFEYSDFSFNAGYYGRYCDIRIKLAYGYSTEWDMYFSFV